MRVRLILAMVSLVATTAYGEDYYLEDTAQTRLVSGFEFGIAMPKAAQSDRTIGSAASASIGYAIDGSCAVGTTGALSMWRERVGPQDTRAHSSSVSGLVAGSVSCSPTRLLSFRVGAGGQWIKEGVTQETSFGPSFLASVSLNWVKTEDYTMNLGASAITDGEGKNAMVLMQVGFQKR